MSTPVVLDQRSFDALRHQHQQHRYDQSNRNKSGGGGVKRHQTAGESHGLIKFLNNHSSETAPQRGIMRITDASVNKYLVADKPDATYRWLYFVNVLYDVGPGKTGFGSFLKAELFNFDHNYVLYDTGSTPAYGQRWGPKADSWLLWQHRPGFLILGGTTGTGSTSRVLAMQLPPGEVRVQNDTGGAVGAGSSGTMGIYGGASGTTDTGLEVTLTNSSSSSWGTSKYGFATADAGGLIWGAPHQR